MSMTNRGKSQAAAGALATGALVVAGAALATTSWASAATAAGAGRGASAGMGASASVGKSGYNFRTRDNAGDLTFNQLLGINNEGLIAGYFGSGAQGHPNKGYLLKPNGNYMNENFPGSVQTQVTGLNDDGVTVGFWSNHNNASQVNPNFGFYAANGHFHTADYPAPSPAQAPVDQLLGVNNHDVAVGFYTDARGNNHGYEYNINDNKYSLVTDPAAPAASLSATAINNVGDVAGVYTNPATGNTDGFLKWDGGFDDLAAPGASSTMALGVNDHGEVVGVYTPSSDANALHGFTWTARGGFVTVDDPLGAGTTTINGVNNAGDLVGFYVDGNNNTDGFVATPVTHTTTLKETLNWMPRGQVIVSESSLTASVSEYGLTPGSSHEVAATLGGQTFPVGTLTANSGGSAAATYSLASALSGARAHGDAASAGLPAVKLEILNAGAGTPAIGITPVPVTGSGRYPFYGVEPGGHGTLEGSTTLVYDPSAQTLTVTVSASGLTPGAHAAHIHDGSCQSQGAVQYMLPDFTADSHGVINHQTRVVAGVSGVMFSGGWYLNLHQGNSNNILNSQGQPTINFRPLLCANL